MESCETSDDLAAGGNAMRLQPMLVTAVLAACTGAVGYYRGATAEQRVVKLAPMASVAGEYFVSSDSFSEVARVTAMLDGLAMQYVDQARQLIAQEILGRRIPQRAEESSQGSALLAAVALLEEGMTEFRGTRQELILVPTLLADARFRGSGGGGSMGLLAACAPARRRGGCARRPGLDGEAGRGTSGRNGGGERGSGDREQVAAGGATRGSSGWT
jgi:hypothetical protein